MLCSSVTRQWIKNEDSVESRTRLPINMTKVYLTIAGIECFDGDTQVASIGAGTRNNIVHVVTSRTKVTYAVIIGR